MDNIFVEIMNMKFLHKIRKQDYMNKMLQNSNFLHQLENLIMNINKIYIINIFNVAIV
jgi:hypothetical protein